MFTSTEETRALRPHRLIQSILRGRVIPLLTLLLAFLGKNRLDNDAQMFGQILELADVIGREGLVQVPHRRTGTSGAGAAGFGG